jgi:hypothetical protein
MPLRKDVQRRLVKVQQLAAAGAAAAAACSRMPAAGLALLPGCTALAMAALRPASWLPLLGAAAAAAPPGKTSDSAA